MKKRTTRVLAMCLACLVVLGGMFFPASKPAQAAEVITVGTNPEFPPFEYIGNNGEAEGFDIAVIKAIGEVEGFDVKIVNMEFKSLVASLANGSLDASIAGMTVTEERKRSVDFSDSYYTARQCIVIPKDSDITCLADLNGKKIGVQEGTTGDLLSTPSEDNTVITDKNTQVQRFKKGTDAVVSLNNGGVDAVVIDQNPAETFVENNEGKLKLIEDNTSTEEYAIAVGKNNKELLTRINSGLKKIKEDGTFDKLVAQYIGGETEEKPAEEITINVGTNAEFPPFEYMDDNGEPAGFDIAVMEAIAEAEGMKVNMINMEFKSLVASLTNGSVDAVIAGMTVTPDRQRSVDFSDSYYTATQGIVVKKDSDITCLADLNGKKIGVQEGTTGDFITTPGEDNEIITDASTDVQRYKKGSDAVVALKNGGVDAVVIDTNPAQNFVANNKSSLKMIEDDTSTEEYAIAVGKGDTELLAKINHGMQTIKDNGTFDKLVDEYISQNVESKEEASDNPIANFINNLKFVFIETNGYKLMLNGLLVTLGISLGAALIGIVLGFVLALMKLTENRKKRKTICSRIAGAYIDIIRGTPAVVQLLIMFMVIFHSKFAPVAAILSFGLNSGAYVAENIRAGILAVDVGQMEGGRSLGFTYGETMRYIIMPQAIKNIIPALGNEMIALVKETSIVGYVAIVDLTKASDFIISRTYQTFLPLIATAIVYYIIVKIMTKILAMVERRLRQSDNR